MNIQETLAKANEIVKDPKAIVLSNLIRVNSQITELFQGKVKSFGFIETSLPLSNDQQIRDNSGNVVLVHPKLKDDGTPNNALSLSLTFESGETIAVSTLMRSYKSTLGAKPFKSFTGEDYAALVGKTIRCDSVAPDKSTEQMRSVTVGAETIREPRASKAYVFTEVTA